MEREAALGIPRKGKQLQLMWGWVVSASEMAFLRERKVECSCTIRKNRVFENCFGTHWPSSQLTAPCFPSLSDSCELVHLLAVVFSYKFR